MKNALLVMLTIGASLIPRAAYSKGSEPRYSLMNRLLESIQVELLKEDGDVVKRLTLPSGREVNLQGTRRIIIYIADQVPREYALPAVLDVPVKALETGKYESVINGKWRLFVSNSLNLNIEYLGRATVGLVPDYARNPLLFPLRPRGSKESFKQYRENLRRMTRDALQK